MLGVGIGCLRVGPSLGGPSACYEDCWHIGAISMMRTIGMTMGHLHV